MNEDFERMKMEGILWKWTNYWNGWQPRWFTLDNGVLAYYKSKEEVIQGCKGSIKMSVCEIIVNPSDITRLDLVIPAEQHFYLKAGTAQERQQWLVALGSAKASLSSRRRKDSNAASPDVLKTKKSELRLYCDLLMQQVHTVKSTANHKPPCTAETLDEATSLLEATCDTFIKTLEDCMKLADANMLYEMPHQLITDSPLVVPTLNGTTVNVKKQSNGSQRLVMQRSMSISSCSEPPAVSVSVHSVQNKMNGDENAKQNDAGGEEIGTLAAEENEDEETWVDTCDNQEEKIKLNEIYEDVNRSKKPVIDTFFSTLEISFLNMKITNDDGIPTDHFLKSCSVVNVIFDLFGSPIFVPMKMDVSGNLRKITAKYNTNPHQFVTLQDIVLYELATQTHKLPNSGTDALLWLKRGLEFVYEFLIEFSRGNPDLKDSALNAYNKTLKQYHGWIVRGVISAATHTVPSRHEVLTKLALRPTDIHHPAYEEQLKEDARLFLARLEQIIAILNQFYKKNELDKKEVV